MKNRKPHDIVVISDKVDKAVSGCGGAIATDSIQPLFLQVNPTLIPEVGRCESRSAALMRALGGTLLGPTHIGKGFAERCHHGCVSVRQPPSAAWPPRVAHSSPTLVGA